MPPYLKPAAAFSAAVLAVIVAQLTDGRITPSEWVVIAIAVVNALNVAIVPNLPSGVAWAAKALVVVSGAVLATLTDAILSGGISGSEAAQLAMVALQAVLVFLAPGGTAALRAPGGTQSGSAARAEDYSATDSTTTR